MTRPLPSQPDWGWLFLSVCDMIDAMARFFVSRANGQLSILCPPPLENAERRLFRTAGSARAGADHPAGLAATAG